MRLVWLFTFLSLIVVIGSFVAIHEYTHGAVIRLFGGEPEYGVTLNEIYTKARYLPAMSEEDLRTYLMLQAFVEIIGYHTLTIIITQIVSTVLLSMWIMEAIMEQHQDREVRHTKRDKSIFSKIRKFLFGF